VSKINVLSFSGQFIFGSLAAAFSSNIVLYLFSPNFLFQYIQRKRDGLHEVHSDSMGISRA